MLYALTHMSVLMTYVPWYTSGLAPCGVDEGHGVGARNQAVHDVVRAEYFVKSPLLVIGGQRVFATRRRSILHPESIRLST
jgi:hypothetical protein